MQIARYEPFQQAPDAAGYDQRRRAAPVERVLEGELLRGERRHGQERRGDTRHEQAPPPAALGFVPPPPVLPGNIAIAAYLRTADPGLYSPPARMHLVV